MRREGLSPPPKAVGSPIADGIYTFGSASVMFPSLAPRSGNYRSQDPLWGGDRRCDVRKFDEWSANTEDGESFAMSSARGGMCNGCGQEDEGKHSLGGGNRQILIVADTYFPPMVGANGKCIPVLRIQLSSPKTAQCAIIKYFDDESRRVAPALVRKTKPPMVLIILALTGHLRRVGVHAYLEDVRSLAGAIQFSLEKKKGLDVRTGLMVLPFMEKHDSAHDVLATNSAHLANVMCIAKEQSKIKLPLFVDSYLAMLKDIEARKDQVSGQAIRVHPMCPLMRNTSAILTSNFAKITRSLGFIGIPAVGAALTPHAEIVLATNLVNEISVYLENEADFVPPEVNDLGQGVAEAIPRTDCEQEWLRLRELQDFGIDEEHTRSKYKDAGIIVACGGSETDKLKTMLTAHVSGIRAQRHWVCQSIRINNRDQLPADEKILKFVSDDFHVAGLPDDQKPIIILRFLDAELLGVRESGARLPAVISKSKKRKFDDFATPAGNRARKARTCLERPALRSPEELVLLIKRLIELVTTLKDMGSKVILICPMPRHFTPCCGNEEHFGRRFPHEDYLKTVYELSTFINVLPDMKNVDILHPGEVIGWGRPSEKRVVIEDGVHLQPHHTTKIFKSVLASIRSVRSGCLAPTDRMSCATFTPETYPGFVRITRAKGSSFQCPPKQ